MTTSERSAPKALITATAAAVEELKKLSAAAGEGKDGVRLGVKGGGCSGFSYVLEFDARREGDHVLEQDGVAFLIDRKSAIYLKGVLLDYRGGLRGKGFAFQNPNAANTCGCGESFAV
ncbi:MAG: iron-sulfur cluster assembly accessory protein [Candidatus Hydrogenedentes bacterium]|nr:iron-sulfur cluster assembly accessory protein [Candidatus Hydrogenedentota bacterium]